MEGAEYDVSIGGRIQRWAVRGEEEGVGDGGSGGNGRRRKKGVLGGGRGEGGHDAAVIGIGFGGGNFTIEGIVAVVVVEG